MTLQQTAEIVTKWISSCETTEQLDLLVEVMDKFIFERFASSPSIELEVVKMDLDYAWLTRKLIVAST